jgi:hypothetical protein
MIATKPFAFFLSRLCLRPACFCLLLWVAGSLWATPLKAQNTPIAINRTIDILPGSVLKVTSALPIELKLTGNAKKQVAIGLDLQGQALDASVTTTPLAGSQGKTILVQIAAQTPAAHVKSGRLTLSVPDSMVCLFTLSEGQLWFARATVNATLTLGKGDVRINQLGGKMTAFVRQGSISCDNSQLKANFTVPSGMIALSSCSGTILAQGPDNSLSIRSSTQEQKNNPKSTSQLQASLQKGRLVLKASQEDISAQLRNGVLDFQWKGDRKTAGYKLDFQAFNSTLNLDLPDGFSMDLNLDQSQSEAFLTASQPTSTEPAATRPIGPQQGKGKKMKLESEFALTAPSEKEITRQGRKMKVAQGRQVIEGGANKVTIHATDSEVNFRKIKAVTK